MKAVELAYRYLGNVCLKRADFHATYLCARPDAPPDFEKAVEYLSKAILVDAEIVFTGKKDFGRGVGKGIELYAPWKADGRNQLALLYLNGEGVFKDIQKGVTLLKEGWLYEQEFKKVFEEHKCCTDHMKHRLGKDEWLDMRYWSAGAKAAFLLGLVYESGGLDMQEDSADYAEAVRWYTDSAHPKLISGFMGMVGNVESIPAMLKLSQIYFEGLGVEKSFNKAMDLRERAQRVQAQRNLNAEPWWLQAHRENVANFWDNLPSIVAMAAINSATEKRLNIAIDKNRRAIASANSKARQAALNQKRAYRRAAGLSW